MNIFIDTCVLLEFYLYADDRVSVIENLVSIAEKGLVRLLIPDQVKKEFWRNREGKIDKEIKDFASIKFMPGAAKLIQEHPDFANFRTLMKNAEERHRKIVKELRAIARDENSSVDKLIRRIFDVATELDADEDTIDRAHRRHLRGIPPGKKSSFGDELNWETLLSLAPNGDIAIVSQDGDYMSEQDKRTLRRYLQVEWKNKKDGDAVLYSRISQLLSECFPEAKSAAEIEKDFYATRLLTSPNFASTHKAIADLSGFSEFSDPTAKKIASAFIENSQVRWIVEDEDVNEFLAAFLAANEDRLTPEQVKALTEMKGTG